MIEKAVRRLNCSHEECVKRFRERSEKAFDAGDIEASLWNMKWVPQPEPDADCPKTLPPAGMDFS